MSEDESCIICRKIKPGSMAYFILPKLGGVWACHLCATAINPRAINREELPKNERILLGGRRLSDQEG